MQKDFRLRKNGQFRYVYRKGKGGGCRELSLAFVPAHRLLVGFAVSKKVGGAVTRNLVKRRLRAAFSSQIPRLRRGMYVVTAREEAANVDYQQLLRSLCYLMRKQQLYVDKTP